MPPVCGHNCVFNCFTAKKSTSPLASAESVNGGVAMNGNIFPRNDDSMQAC
jgi:hypothetical protein